MRDEEKQPLKISVIIPVHNGEEVLAQCLRAVKSSSFPRCECIVVDDGSTDGTKHVAERFGVRVVGVCGGPLGPAHARNSGAEASNGEILFFLDADVVVHRDALDRVAQCFEQNPDVAAVFGSYDCSPEATEVVSQFKNLSHHFVHQHSRTEAATFWSGCGAVRRSAFQEMGGFDEARYSRPSIEDIDLGRRLRIAGHRILLDKEIQGKHLKRWTLRGMTQTDILYRGIPWTLLMLQDRSVPDDLNLRFSQRVSAVLVYMMFMVVGLIGFYRNIAVATLLAALFLLAAGNWHWRAGVAPFRGTQRAEGLTYFLLLGISGVAAYTGDLWVVVPLAPLLLALLVKHLWPESHLPWNRFFYSSMLLGLALALALSLRGTPEWLVVLPLSIAIAVVLLNYQFFAFLARQRGVLFALTAIPFQMLYYSYSVLAFVLGFCLYLWRDRAKRQSDKPSVINP